MELEYHTTGDWATRLAFGLGAEDAAELGAQLVQLRVGAHHRRPLSTFSAASMPDQWGPGRAVAALTMSFRASKARNGLQKLAPPGLHCFGPVRSSPASSMVPAQQAPLFAETAPGHDSNHRRRPASRSTR